MARPFRRKEASVVSNFSSGAPRTPSEPRGASVYVHFPWCLAKCPYCDFVSYAKPREEVDSAAYADAVLRELEARRTATGPRRIQTVFFGGGTPSLWEPAELGRVLAGIRSAYEPAPGEELEITVECNPTSLDRPRADALARAGVNRLSIGTQSLDAGQLKFLGRLHDPAGALAAIDDALASDVARVSTDLIFGLPGQAPADASAQASLLAERESGGRRLTHLSCYQLTIEPGTQFGALAKRGRLPLADDGLVAEAFLAIDAALGARGFGHYEISNYAVPGDEARHNLGYWRGEEYIGIGCAAYGMLRDARDASGATAPGLRYRNAIDPRAYAEATRAARGDRVGEGDGVTISSEALDATALLRERIMLGLRLAAGLDLEACGADLGVDPFTPERARVIDQLVTRGRVVREGGRLRVPREAWLWTDDTAARLF
jgi:putative oxygen-independent coproporphyrinogen III oxidase